jgi:phosphohistidine phosphatase
MILTIWRHGEADGQRPDRNRELTDTGRDDVAFGCHRFSEVCQSRGVPNPHRVLYSPWVRTTQTAEIVTAAFTHADSQAEQRLEPGMNVADVDALLSQLVEFENAVEHLVIVSHQPLVSNLVDYYLGGGGMTAVPGVSPGGLVCLSLDIPAPDCGTLLFWAFPPEYEAGL